MSGSLTHTPADVLRYLLIDLVVGTLPEDDSDCPIYVSNEPDTPDECITVFWTAGITHGRDHNSGKMWEHYGIQIRIRSTDDNALHTLAESVKDAVDCGIQMSSVTIDSSTYVVHAVTRKSGPLPIGKESPTSKRVLSTINAVISLRQTS